MGRHEQKWKRFSRHSNAGGNVYVGKERLEKLAEEAGLDLDEPMRYKVSHGTSDGRARVFVEIENIDTDGSVFPEAH